MLNTRTLIFAGWLVAIPAGTNAQGITTPAQIDEAVEAFTGFPAGTVGGARERMDDRLRLRQCAQPLRADWYGTRRQTVSVQCPGARGWRIFVATRPLPAQAPAARVVKRGEALSIAVRGKGFSIQQQGFALEGGAVGDWINVRIGERIGRARDSVSAQIVRPGLAVVRRD